MMRPVSPVTSESSSAVAYTDTSRDVARSTVDFRRTLGDARQEPAAVAPGQPSTARSAATYHVVGPGETLWSICSRKLASFAPTPGADDIHLAVAEAARISRIANPNLIHPGQKVVLPFDLPSVQYKSTEGSPQANSRGNNAGRQVSATDIYPSLAHAPRVQTETTASGLRSARATTPERGVSAASVAARRVSSQESYQRRRILGRNTDLGMDFKADDTTALMQSLIDSSHALRLAAHGDTPWRALLGGQGRLTSGFGMRKDPFTGRLQHHAGIDIAAPAGTKIYPVAPGRVVFSGWDGGYGRLVVVRHDDGTETRYAHASKNIARPGDRVTTDTAIALVGSSGRSTGPHLHFEYRVNGRSVDPVPHLKKSVLQIASNQ